MKIYNALFLLTIGVFIACSPKTTEIIEETEEVTEINENNNGDEMPKADIGEGKLIFLKKCGKCHDIPVVENYSLERWQKIIPPMAKKANLTEIETVQLEKYIRWELDN